MQAYPQTTVATTTAYPADTALYPGQMIVRAQYPQVRRPRRWWAAKTDPVVAMISKLETKLYRLYLALDYIALHGEGGLYEVGSYERKQQEVIATETELAYLAKQIDFLGEFDSPLLPNTN